MSGKKIRLGFGIGECAEKSVEAGACSCLVLVLEILEVRCCERVGRTERHPRDDEIEKVVEDDFESEDLQGDLEDLQVGVEALEAALVELYLTEGSLLFGWTNQEAAEVGMVDV